MIENGRGTGTPSNIKGIYNLLRMTRVFSVYFKESVVTEY